ncbi:TcfC E-set like domain-containing protein [Oleomonas cavernae]|nr:TcfC E-set like domain-containing protein [Oleomonas cavernae]
MAACLPPHGPARAAEIIQTAPPPGFDDLRQPQDALVDVIYDGEPIGAFAATFRPGAIRFADPAALAGAVPGLAEREAVTAALSGDLETHAERLCGVAPVPGCGVLEPTVASVIFDADRFRATLFLAISYRGTAAGGQYLPAPADRPGFVQSFAAAASSGEDDLAGSRTSVRSFSLLSLGAARLIADTAADSQQGGALDRLEVQYDHERWRGEAGLYRTTLMPLLGERRFLGAGLTTTLDTLRDADQASGSRLSVFLASRGQVEVYREGRLLSARSYEAGTRELETRDLPDGAYLVTLRVVTQGNVREETRFFVKNAAIPPAGLPFWELDAGVLADDDISLTPEAGGTPFVHAATRYRLSDSFALGGDLVVGSRQQGIGGLFYYQLQQVQLQLDSFASTDGVYGLGLAARGDNGPFSYSGSIRRIWGGEAPRRRAAQDTDDDLSFILRDPDDLFDAGGAATQVNLALDYHFEDGPHLGLRALYLAGADDVETYAAGPIVFWPLFSDGALRLDLSAQATATEEQQFVFAQLRLSWGDGDIDVTSEAGWSGAVAGDEQGDSSSGPFGRAQAIWHTAQAAGERLDLSAATAADSRRTEVSAGLDYQGPKGRVDAEIAHETDGGTRYAGNLFVNVVGDPDALAWGGNEVRGSAVIVAVSGRPDTVYRVLIDEQPRAEVAAGARLVLPLEPYKSYDVRIVQKSGGLVDYDASPRRVTLYPGNVTTLQWNAARFVSLFGQATTPGGAPSPTRAFRPCNPRPSPMPRAISRSSSGPTPPS